MAAALSLLKTLMPRMPAVWLGRVGAGVLESMGMRSFAQEIGQAKVCRSGRAFPTRRARSILESGGAQLP